MAVAFARPRRRHDGSLPHTGNMLRYGCWKDCLPHTVIRSFLENQSVMAQIRDIKSGRVGEPPREPTPRRLAAIVAGDIAGYSRLMQIDEEGTHNLVKRTQLDPIEPSIKHTHRHLVN